MWKVLGNRKRNKIYSSVQTSRSWEGEERSRHNATSLLMSTVFFYPCKHGISKPVYSKKSHIMRFVWMTNAQRGYTDFLVPKDGLPECKDPLVSLLMGMRGLCVQWHKTEGSQDPEMLLEGTKWLPWDCNMLECNEINWNKILLSEQGMSILITHACTHTQRKRNKKERWARRRGKRKMVKGRRRRGEGKGRGREKERKENCTFTDAHTK